MPGRRPLVAFVALFAASLSACLHVSAPATPTTKTDEAAKITARAAEANQQPPPRIEFAVLPKVPGTVVQTRPPANGNPGPLANTSQKPNNTAPTVAPKSVEPLRTIGTEPGPFPLVQSAPPPEPPLLAAVR